MISLAFYVSMHTLSQKGDPGSYVVLVQRPKLLQNLAARSKTCSRSQGSGALPGAVRAKQNFFIAVRNTKTHGD